MFQSVGTEVGVGRVRGAPLLRSVCVRVCVHVHVH